MYHIVTSSDGGLIVVSPQPTSSDDTERPTDPALADTLGEAARGVLGGPTRRPVPPDLLRRGDAAALLAAMARVADAREAAYGNVNPQILLAVLGEELAEVL